ncbi:cytochrome P450 [Blastococcus sp. URHD0036]|uniref:cytochrome P450 n=1 Tax=Blastococcus sp. URHD0036 TaxID=1380356 RepID=UPI0004952ADB|nr:cytochrome P450 [Blastococcus sp. URHD0036]
MSIDETVVTAEDEARKQPRIQLDRHGPGYRTDFVQWVDRLHAEAPLAWNDTHGGYWFVNGNKDVFEVTRRGAQTLSNDADVHRQRRGYTGIEIPAPNPEERGGVIGGFLEMDPPIQRFYRNALNPYLSPAAVARWQPVLDELTRAAIDEKIESGRIDFVEDLANIVPAVLTMAMLGLPLVDWVHYNEPAHATVYTPVHSPDYPRVRQMNGEAGMRMLQSIHEIKAQPRPGLLDAIITADLGDHQQDDMELIGVAMLLIGGGFDTTTALTAHSLEWLSANPDQRERLIREWDELRDSATEEFLRYVSPSQGDGRTVAEDVEINGVQLREGDRLWLSWAMANRDATVFDDPHTVKLDRRNNRHSSFGLGIHRCIGSNLARAGFKTMLKAVLDRMPDYVCDPEGAVYYETTQVINGMRHLPATFTPGRRLGPGLAETIERLQHVVVEQRLAEPVTVRRDAARSAG